MDGVEARAAAAAAAAVGAVGVVVAVAVVCVGGAVVRAAWAMGDRLE